MSEARQSNRDQAALWNEASGRTWVEMQHVLDRMLAPFAPLLVDGVPADSARVLDVGCGAGATTLAMARRLGPRGHCLGVDISAPLVAAARARAVTDGVVSAEFLEADAQTHRCDPGSCDAVISRFGVMFFDDPVAAFANLRGAARRGAPLTFVAWRSPAENAFLTLAGRAAAPLLPGLRAPDPRHERLARRRHPGDRRADPHRRGGPARVHHEARAGRARAARRRRAHARPRHRGAPRRVRAASP